MDIFLGGFYILVALCAILHLATRVALPPTSDASFNAFQRTYLVVYLLAMAGDWLQGPHVYALYENYGMTMEQIDLLFVAGFGSSMIFGTVVGSVADRCGRRTNCIMYGVLYGLTCLTKHSSNFYVLMFGRLLGGIATSILYSAFESWLVYEHHKRGFDSNLLGNIFSLGVLGNSMVAIGAGLVAQKFADTFGFVAPFDVSLLTLMLMVILIVMTWSENYGDKTSSLAHSFGSAFSTIRADPKVLCLGLIQSLFEGAMYCFVLEWTPSLSIIYINNKSNGSTEEKHSDIPHGHIFAAFMVSLMIGSSLFKLLCKLAPVESFMRFVLFAAALSLTMPIFYKGNQLYIFGGFLVFETCVGIFWPSMGTMRGKYIAEETRATTMNIFRVPLNFIVIIILLQHLELDTIFQFCTVLLLVAVLCQHWLFTLYESTAKTTPLHEKAMTLRSVSMLEAQRLQKELGEEEEEMV
ncbi:molybdate-anion transporter-like isoform x1 [Plakobranchus ocellatus]|uniref:Molybdate-anion transporter-like isoform x1 n=1 Tax=Plakobranchus ocellatus TaxID=259542 RepID=A0AAV4BPF5_9GAST|nr:molybdate-anion transporter-like isoform x1 [Plakobranchus ocellatus]